MQNTFLFCSYWPAKLKPSSPVQSDYSTRSEWCSNSPDRVSRRNGTSDRPVGWYWATGRRIRFNPSNLENTMSRTVSCQVSVVREKSKRYTWISGEAPTGNEVRFRIKASLRSWLTYDELCQPNVTKWKYTIRIRMVDSPVRTGRTRRPAKTARYAARRRNERANGRAERFFSGKRDESGAAANTIYKRVVFSNTTEFQTLINSTVGTQRRIAAPRSPRRRCLEFDAEMTKSTLILFIKTAYDCFFSQAYILWFVFAPMRKGIRGMRPFISSKNQNHGWIYCAPLSPTWKGEENVAFYFVFCVQHTRMNLQVLQIMRRSRILI